VAYPYFIFDAPGHRLVGALTLSNVRRGVAQTGTLGYWVGAPFRAAGLHDLRRQADPHFAFQHLALHRVEAACLPHNEASIALLQRDGLRA
jgi:[ribosomal protein S5]-alanine N-acetyltransferase